MPCGIMAECTRAMKPLFLYNLTGLRNGLFGRLKRAFLMPRKARFVRRKGLSAHWNNVASIIVGTIWWFKTWRIELWEGISKWCEASF